MQHRLAFFIFTLSLSTLAVFQILALTFYLYWIYPWFDIPMHFLGGVTVALGFHALPILMRYLPKSGKGFWGTVCFVVVVGILWELYELFFGAPREAAYLADTALDLVMDTLGGVFGFYIARSFKVLEEE